MRRCANKETADDVVADRPTRDHGGFSASWRRLVACRATDLSSTERGLWDLLGGHAGCWRCAMAPSALYPDRRVILIDHAPSSQFEVLQTALRADIALPDGLICLALTGTGFRGQRQRPWTALRGNLHLTAHYRLNLPAAPPKPP